MSKEPGFTKNDQIKHLNALNGYKAKKNITVINLVQNADKVSQASRYSSSSRMSNTSLIIAIGLLCVIGFLLTKHFIF